MSLLTAFSDMKGIKKFNGLMKNPTLETLKRFAVVLDVPMQKLFVSDIRDESAANGITQVCPHCGKPITVKTTIV